MSEPIDDDLAFAHGLADAAAEVALPFFGRPTRSHTKADGTPVGEADLAVDAVLRDLLRSRRPADAVLSEESGEEGRARRRWIVDPIDGTVAFLSGTPHWGTHVALEVDGAVALAVVTRPAMGLRWWAARGGGAFRGSGLASHVERLQTSPVARLEESRVAGWEIEGSAPMGAQPMGAQPMGAQPMGAQPLAAQPMGAQPMGAQPLAALRSVGIPVDVAYNDLLAVVDARADIMVVPGQVWDHAPFVVLLEEAGGAVLDPHGGGRLDLGWVLFTNGHVAWEELAPALSGRRPGA